jgi:predicted nucleic acid-binding Zn ribbon protein
MPVYEYECKSKHRTERVKSFKVSNRVLNNDICFTCGEPAKLVPSRTGHPILIGQGFHANDYGAPTKT